MTFFIGAELGQVSDVTAVALVESLTLPVVQRIIYAENETDHCPTCQTGGVLLADRSLSRLLCEIWLRSLDEMEEQATRQRGRPG